MLQEEFAELREALAGERKEASAAQAASAEELQSLKRQHKAAVQVCMQISSNPGPHAQEVVFVAWLPQHGS